MYIYDEVGILRDRVDYQNIVNRCGRPTAISENGQYMLLMKQGQSTELHIVKISVTGLKLIQTIDLRDQLNNYINKVTNQNALFKQALTEVTLKKK